ncbi:MAG: hypothetical protein HN714_05350 [Formosa sp.]|jgi:hypothetical protein|nr:hypothetical protein [Formosa sp.]
MISAFVISFDDYDYIKECISSLDFADEIIIVGKIDPELRSNIIHKNTVQFVESESLDYNVLLMEARSKASHEWIIGIEADHCISKPLAEEITNIASNTNLEGNYKVKTRFKFMGKILNFSGYRTSYNSLLFHKNSITNKRATKKLKHPIEKLYLDFDRYNKRLTKKAKQKASVLYNNKRHPNFFNFLFNPLWKLKQTFIFKLGFLDGKEGFVFAYLIAFKEFKTYLFLWLMYRNIE